MKRKEGEEYEEICFYNKNSLIFKIIVLVKKREVKYYLEFNFDSLFMHILSLENK